VGTAVVAAVVVVATVAWPSGLRAQEPESDPGPLSWEQFRTVVPAEPDARVRWGTHPEQTGELYLPEGAGPHPVAVLVHGGCWLSIADTRYTSHLARTLADAGWAVWAPEFRRVDMPGGEWPGILVDVGAGADHLREVATEYRLDVGRVVLVGHSSGGHLALWLAGRRNLEASDTGVGLRGSDPLAVRGVVGLAAIAGVADYHARNGGGCGPDAVAALLGGDPAVHRERLRIAEPGPRLPRDLPVLLATGELDSVVPLVHGEAFAAQVGRHVRVVRVPAAGHFEVVAPWTAGFAALWRELEPFLDEVALSSSDEGRR
jgi:acetyl esterase/lipase